MLELRPLPPWCSREEVKTNNREGGRKREEQIKKNGKPPIYRPMASPSRGKKARQGRVRGVPTNRKRGLPTRFWHFSGGEGGWYSPRCGAKGKTRANSRKKKKKKTPEDTRPVVKE